jgi:TRAP-type C4-dicarboxylate transport system substrate-binding protein
MAAVMVQEGPSGTGGQSGSPQWRRTVLGACAGLLLLVLTAAGAGAQNLKFASLAPEETVWVSAIRQIGEEWHRLSGGSIDMTVFPNGVAGDETDILRKIRTGQLHGGAISALGLADLYPGVLALGMPFMFENQEELDYATEQLRPLMEEEFERRGFKVLMWTAAGWVYFYSREPSLIPADLQRQKLNVPDADPRVVSAWQRAGFRIAVVPITELMLGLQTGLVDAVLNTPLIVAPMQWFGVAKHMNALEIAPFYGAMLISMRTWRRLPEDLRPQLLAAVQELGGEATAAVLEAERFAVEIMRRFGLTIHQPTAEQAAEWRVLQRGFESMVGPVVDEQAFKVVIDALADYRAGRAASP